jgi:hypothetical protein
LPEDGWRATVARFESITCLASVPLHSSRSSADERCVFVPVRGSGIAAALAGWFSRRGGAAHDPDARGEYLFSEGSSRFGVVWMAGLCERARGAFVPFYCGLFGGARDAQWQWQAGGSGAEGEKAAGDSCARVCVALSNDGDLARALEGGLDGRDSGGCFALYRGGAGGVDRRSMVCPAFFEGDRGVGMDGNARGAHWIVGDGGPMAAVLERRAGAVGGLCKSDDGIALSSFAVGGIRFRGGVVGVGEGFRAL